MALALLLNQAYKNNTVEVWDMKDPFAFLSVRFWYTEMMKTMAKQKNAKRKKMLKRYILFVLHVSRYI